jgi:hypothetical protein
VSVMDVRVRVPPLVLEAGQRLATIGCKFSFRCQIGLVTIL